MKILFGDVLLARFPFTDLTSDKRRPVLVVSAKDDGEDVTVCAITSRDHNGTFDIAVTPSENNGLKASSRVQFDKIATLKRSVISGKLGSMPAAFMNTHASLFISQFGFLTCR